MYLHIQTTCTSKKLNAPWRLLLHPFKRTTSDEILETTDMRYWQEDNTKSPDVTYHKKISRVHRMIFNATWPPPPPHTHKHTQHEAGGPNIRAITSTCSFGNCPACPCVKTALVMVFSVSPNNISVINEHNYLPLYNCVFYICSFHCLF